jgi:hypothetical protein
VFTAVAMKNAIFWELRHVALVRVDVSDELIASNIRVTGIGELGTTLALTSNRSMLRSSHSISSQILTIADMKIAVADVPSGFRLV